MYRLVTVHLQIFDNASYRDSGDGGAGLIFQQININQNKLSYLVEEFQKTGFPRYFIYMDSLLLYAENQLSNFHRGYPLFELPKILIAGKSYLLINFFLF